MKRLIYFDDFGTETVSPLLGNEEDLQKEANRRNRELENQGLDEYGLWWVK